MARYVVRFMKVMLGENGHETEICQRSMEVDAADKLKAADLAMVSFCESECVKEWSLHADRVHITDAEFPMKIKMLLP
jgi:hypothetical protein